MTEIALADQTCRCVAASNSRLSSIGAMGVVLAHEIAQPVTAAGQFLDASLGLIRGSDPENPELEDLLSRAAGQIDRIANIVERMQSFVRNGQLSCRSESLEAIVRNAIASLPEAAVSGVELVVNIGRGADEIEVDRVQMEQVLVNIIGNACEALEFWDRKRIEIGATREKSQILIRISDSGPGLSPKRFEQVFDPLFTTRQSGLGLGLALCRSIVEAHGGAIWADNAANGGALFSMFLPVRAARQADQNQQPLRLAWAEGQRITGSGND